METNSITTSLPGLAGAFSAGTLFASLIWGSIGVGFCIYGKKQGSAPALVGGVALVAISYLIWSALWMSVTACAILAGIWFWSRHQ